ncbi:MAG: hypothetical protein AAF565_17850, partial [Pseudomonadota bacterium]
FGRIIAGERAGVIAAALLAAWPVHIFYSQEARSYTLLLFLILLSATALADALGRPPEDRRRSYLVFAFFAGLTFWVHYIGVFWIALGIAVIALDVLAEGKRARHLRPPLRTPLRTLGPAAILLGVLFAAALPQFFGGLYHALFTWLAVPDLATLIETIHTVYGVLGLGKLNAPLSLMLVGMASLGLALLALRRWQQAALVAGLCLIPVALFIVSQVKPVLLVRTAQIGVPGVVLAIAVLLARLPSAYAYLSTAAIAAVLVMSTERQRDHRPLFSKDLEEEVALFYAELRPGDTVLFNQNMTYNSVHYFLPDNREASFFLRCDNGKPVRRAPPDTAWQEVYLGSCHNYFLANPFADQAAPIAEQAFLEAAEDAERVWLVDWRNPADPARRESFEYATGRPLHLWRDMGLFDVYRSDAP